MVLLIKYLVLCNLRNPTFHRVIVGKDGGWEDLFGWSNQGNIRSVLRFSLCFSSFSFFHFVFATFIGTSWVGQDSQGLHQSCNQSESREHHRVFLGVSILFTVLFLVPYSTYHPHPHNMFVSVYVWMCVCVFAYIDILRTK